MQTNLSWNDTNNILAPDYKTASVWIAAISVLIPGWKLLLSRRQHQQFYSNYVLRKKSNLQFYYTWYGFFYIKDLDIRLCLPRPGLEFWTRDFQVSNLFWDFWRTFVRWFVWQKLVLQSLLRCSGCSGCRICVAILEPKYKKTD